MTFLLRPRQIMPSVKTWDTALARVGSLSLVKMLATWRWTVCLLTARTAAMSSLLRPRETQPQHLNLARCEEMGRALVEGTGQTAGMGQPHRIRQLRQDCSGHQDLLPGSIHVVCREEGLGEPQPRLSLMVPQACPVVPPHCLLEQDRSLARRSKYSVSHSGHREQCIGPHDRRGRAQLIGSQEGCRVLTRGVRDADCGEQDISPGQTILCREAAEKPLQRRPCASALAGGELDEHTADDRDRVELHLQQQRFGLVKSSLTPA